MEYAIGELSLFAKSADAVRQVATRFVHRARSLLRPGGTIVMLETLGTRSDTPAAPPPALETFYAALESDHGFSQTELRTDFSFPDIETAIDLMGFFFGPAMENTLREHGSATIREWTGAWRPDV